MKLKWYLIVHPRLAPILIEVPYIELGLEYNLILQQAFKITGQFLVAEVSYRERLKIKDYVTAITTYRGILLTLPYSVEKNAIKKHFEGTFKMFSFEEMWRLKEKFGLNKPEENKK